jgi:hypothetical protein
METQGGDGDMVDSGHFEDAHVLISLVFVFIDGNLDHFESLSTYPGQAGWRQA